jgi:hypothetical protein
MFEKLHAVWAVVRGKNSAHTPKETILAQTQEKRLLPVGRAEFEEWSDRIISGTLLPADPESMKFALADMLMRLSPTECSKDDAYFIASLRKYAVNQVADVVRKELYAAKKTKEDAEKSAKEEAIKKEQDALAAATLARIEANKPSAVTPTSQEGVHADGNKVLAN